jgi:hypothetical protein
MQELALDGETTVGAYRNVSTTGPSQRQPQSEMQKRDGWRGTCAWK